MEFFYRKNFNFKVAFRLPYRHEIRLVPVDNSYKRIWADGRNDRSIRDDADGDVGLLVGCPAGYGLHNTHCCKILL